MGGGGGGGCGGCQSENYIEHKSEIYHGPNQS